MLIKLFGNFSPLNLMRRIFWGRSNLHSITKIAMSDFEIVFSLSAAAHTELPRNEIISDFSKPEVILMAF